MHISMVLRRIKKKEKNIKMLEVNVFWFTLNRKWIQWWSNNREFINDDYIFFNCKTRQQIFQEIKPSSLSNEMSMFSCMRRTQCNTFFQATQAIRFFKQRICMESFGSFLLAWRTVRTPVRYVVNLIKTVFFLKIVELCNILYGKRTRAN